MSFATGSLRIKLRFYNFARSKVPVYMHAKLEIYTHRNNVVSRVEHLVRADKTFVRYSTAQQCLLLLVDLIKIPYMDRATDKCIGTQGSVVDILM